jgi:hypothetical protein
LFFKEKTRGVQIFQWGGGGKPDPIYIRGITFYISKKFPP